MQTRELFIGSADLHNRLSEELTIFELVLEDSLSCCGEQSATKSLEEQDLGPSQRLVFTRRFVTHNASSNFQFQLAELCNSLTGHEAELEP